MKQPIITVVIPAYNAEEYIGRCLDSVLKQSFQNFEVLVIDDGSTDGTGKVVKEYMESDERVIYKKQKNVGVAKTRNKAVKLARGKFVAFIDNDDYIDNDYLEVLLPNAGEDVVISGFRRPNENGKIVQEVKLENTSWSKFVNPTPWAKIYRKDFILDNEIEFLDNDIGEDIYFNLIAMLLAKQVRILDYVGYNWFLNSKSVSSTEHKDFDKVNVFRLLDSCYEELERRGLLAKNYELVEFFFYRFAVWFLLYSSKGQTRNKIAKICKELFVWLKERFPGFEKNKFLKGTLPGETKSTRMAYRVFLKFYRMGLGGILVWLYAKI